MVLFEGGKRGLYIWLGWEMGQGLYIQIVTMHGWKTV